MKTRFILSVLIGLAFSACVTSSGGAEHHSSSHGHDEPRPYFETADAAQDVEAALSRARLANKLTIVAMGANWCHDSRAFAHYWEQPRFVNMLSEDYELVYVDVGQKIRNIDIANRFGEESILGTPTVFIVDTDGKVLNPDTAPTWRNAASRDIDDVYEYFRRYAER